MKTRSSWRQLLALLMVSIVLLAACGGSDDGDDAATGGGDTASEGGGEGGGGDAEAFEVDTAECDEAAFTNGITDTEIKIGTSAAQSGPLAAFGLIGKSIEAHFKYVNAEKGGVKGRKLTFVTKDDAYDPSRTITNVKELVQSEKVFAILNLIGTPNNLAVRDDLNEECVPQLFTGTGFPAFGDIENYPWTVGFNPSYETEAKTYVEDIERKFPEGGTLALLYTNNDFGKAYQKAVQEAIEGTKITLAKEQPLDPKAPSVSSEVTTLAATNADFFFNGTTGAFCPQTMKAVAESSWKPKLFYQSNTCASINAFFKPVDPAGDNVITTAYVKDPTDPQWENDASMKLYKEKLAQYGSGLDPNNANLLYGWTVAELFVTVLNEAEELDRPSVLNAARNLDAVSLPLALPGVSFTTSGDDAYPVEALQIQKYNAAKKAYDFEGELIDLEGKTPKFEG